MKQICELNDRLILGQEGRSHKAPRLTEAEKKKRTEVQWHTFE